MDTNTRKLLARLFEDLADLLATNPTPHTVNVIYYWAGKLYRLHVISRSDFYWLKQRVLVNKQQAKQ